MTQEERKLLLQDLCARLPYGVVVHFEGWNPEKLTQIDLRELVFNDMGGIPKPYLRPLSSMTDEEREEYSLFIGEKNGYSYFIDPISQMDWLNKKMFDYRGLIPKGLTLEAPEGMYIN